MITLTIDGQTVTVAPGTTILEAAASIGTPIPHYCYHPDIGVDGNCRMCLVEVNGNTHKLAISCQLPVGEGMKVETKSPAVKKAQEGVLEFLLINHPLDCTICDQAGECPLQEYTYEYGPSDSRFVEDKQKKPKKVAFSDKVLFDGERCILCTRCVRFFENVRGSSPLGVENMGGESLITTGPHGDLVDPYQMNIIDICPVGALTSRDFRFKQRVWFMDFTETVCPGCARGCNMTAGAYQNELLRFVPRRNVDVNKSWMCDDGRLAYGAYNVEERTRDALVLGEPASIADALAKVAELVGDGTGVAVLASTADTSEDLFALRHWAEGAGITTHWHGARTWAGDDFLKCDDATPNTAGARALGYVPAPARQAGLRGLIVAGDVDVPGGLLDGLDFLVLQAPVAGVLAPGAAVVLPGRTPLEKRGTFTNVDGIAQRVRPARDPGRGVPDDWTLWRDLAGADWPDLPSLQAAMTAGAGAIAGRGARS